MVDGGHVYSTASGKSYISGPFSSFAKCGLSARPLALCTRGPGHSENSWSTYSNWWTLKIHFFERGVVLCPFFRWGNWAWRGSVICSRSYNLWVGKLDFRLRSRAPILSSQVFWGKEDRLHCRKEGVGLGLGHGAAWWDGEGVWDAALGRQSWVSEIGGRHCFCLLLTSFVSKNINVHLRCLESFPGRHVWSGRRWGQLIHPGAGWLNMGLPVELTDRLPLFIKRGGSWRLFVPGLPRSHSLCELAGSMEARLLWTEHLGNTCAY